MTIRLRRALPAILIPLAFSAAKPAAAWEEKGHRIVNRLAAESMPADTPAFFKAAASRLEYLGPEPDRWRSDSGSQLYAVNGPDHFMDFEPVLDVTLPPDRYKFIAMVREKGIADKYHLTAEKIGFLPYRIAEVAQTLQSEWRDWNKAVVDKAPAEQREQIEQDIIYTAGILGHYVADASNPHHTTVHYNGWDTDFAPNPNGYTTIAEEAKKKPNGFHHRFEGAFVDADVSATGVRPFLAPVKPVGDTFTDAVAFIKATNALVPRLYDLEKAGAFSTAGAVNEDFLRFTEQRLAAGASMLRDIWVASQKGPAPFRPARRRNNTAGNSTTGNGNGESKAPEAKEPAGAGS